jgi:hypothetical protein
LGNDGTLIDVRVLVGQLRAANADERLKLGFKPFPAAIATKVDVEAARGAGGSVSWRRWISDN